MAYTVTRTNTVFGNIPAVILEITADAGTQTIETGFPSVLGISTAFSSMNSANIHIAVNSNTSGVQSMGVIGVTGCTSGDKFFVTVYGRGR